MSSPFHDRGPYRICRAYQWTEFILRKFVLTCSKAELTFFYLSEISFTNIHDSQDSSGRALPPGSQTLRHSLHYCCRELTSAHSWQPESCFLTHFVNHQATHLLKFLLFTLALVAAVVRRTFKTWVTLENISPVLLNLITILIFLMFKDYSLKCSRS